MSKLEDLSGKRFGKLTAIEHVRIEGRKATYWKCICDCGNEKNANRVSLLTSHTTSCGCVRRQFMTEMNLKRATHGKSRTAEYRIWDKMKERCDYPKCHNYHLYGARGIKVCDRWESFENFLEDMGVRPSSKHSIERKDVNGDYEPSNCKWATTKEQTRNTRITNRPDSGVLPTKNGKWTARLSYKHLGTFETKEEAIKSREVAKLKYWGKSS